MGLKVAGAKLLLKGGLLNGNRYLAAMTDASTEFGNTGGYARILMTLSDWEAENSGGWYRNDDEENFPTPTANLADPTHIGLYDAATSGNLLWVNALSSNVNAPQLGSNFGFDENAVRQRVSGVVTADGSKAAMTEGLLSGTRYISLHSASPSASNRQGSSVQVQASHWDFVSGSENQARINRIVTWGAQQTNLADITHFALRDGSGASAKILFADSLDNNPDDPAIGDTISFAANALSITLAVDS